MASEMRYIELGKFWDGSLHIRIGYGHFGGGAFTAMYRIFVVEDDAVIAGQIGKYLEKWGYEVETVKDFADVM